MKYTFHDAHFNDHDAVGVRRRGSKDGKHRGSLANFVANNQEFGEGDRPSGVMPLGTGAVGDRT